MRRPPAFWSNPPDAPGLAARLLSPASVLWQVGARLRRWRARPVRIPVPVICVGNATVGGGGKTPMVAALMQRTIAAGKAPHIVTRGHGGRTTGPHRVDAVRDTAAEVGDEQLLLAAFGPVWVARDRGAGALAAAEAGADLVLLDDGYQNPGIVKDVHILMVDAASGFGNGRIVPAGPLREPLADALARTDVVVLSGPPGAAPVTVETDRPILRGPILRGTITPIRTGIDLAGEAVVAFAGIARPEKLFDSLRSLGADVIAAHPFPDHAPYSDAVLRRLLAEARRENATLVTTDKDAVRLPDWMRREVVVQAVSLDLDDWAPVERLLGLDTALPA